MGARPSLGEAIDGTVGEPIDRRKGDAIGASHPQRDLEGFMSRHAAHNLQQLPLLPSVDRAYRCSGPVAALKPFLAVMTLLKQSVTTRLGRPGVQLSA